MKNKKLYWISFILLSVCNIINSCVNIFEIELPKFVFIVFMIIILASVAALVCFSIKLWLEKSGDKK